MIGDDAPWDAFRSFKRASTYQAPFAPWMVTSLQMIKLGIFATAHALLIFGATISKVIAIVLATNLLNQTPGLDTPFGKQCPMEVNRSGKDKAAIYLALFLIQALPDICAIFQFIYRLFSVGKGQGGLNIMIVLLESCRGLGLSIMFFLVFPQLDIKRALFLLSCLPLIPMIQRLLAKMARSLQPDRPLASRLYLTMCTLPHFLLTLCLLSGCYLWPVLDTPFRNVVVLPVAIILSSIGFWESWIGLGHQGTFFHHLYQIKYGVRKLNAPTRLLASSIRFVLCLIVFFVATNSGGVQAKYYRKVLLRWSLDFKHTQIILAALGVASLNSILRYSARFLAAMQMRLLTCLHPLFLVPPLVLCFFTSLCHFAPNCDYAKAIAGHGLTWRCSQWSSNPRPFDDLYICFVWLVVGMYKGYQVACSPEFEKCDEIIDSMPPFSNGLCIEQSLAVFQHSICKTESKMVAESEEFAIFNDGINMPQGGLRSEEVDKTANLYVCATMWHETEVEMKQMFNSILKLDEERAIIAAKKRKDTTKFRLEVHIFFDDAWEDQDELGRAPNDFFKMFFELINKMTDDKDTFAEESTMPTRILVSTNYGGRLVVRLPAGTLMFVHLKDKKLIRHKKRWSQVMYMYYLLGHRIMDSHLSIEDKQLIADNTYILAIDGDSKFEPEAVMRLLTLMNTKSDIGCACGRIHPIGTGVMVWYQKFEYAIAHWFQKAAEHVFGCVLCAPGCFSLFRASALMDDNIMHKYTTTAVEPRHYVQYDQGEDRWLSTLLLKQGYRIEYAAASDAETYAPEGFEEFFNQRRRWTPSSVANTVDLLADYKRACQNNACISRLYILYQFGVIGFSMLGPAIIFSMLVYAQVAAFLVPMDKIMMYNAIPILTFIISCFTLESNVQLFIAKILSVIYAFVMLAVIVATCSQIVLETLFSPTSMFVVGMIGIFFFAACCHPKEFTNIIHGTVFFLMIPSTYVILSFYSLINLDVISWGTREAVSKVSGEKEDKESSVDKWLGRVMSSPIGRLIPSARPRDDPQLAELGRKLDEMEKVVQKWKATDSDDPFEKEELLKKPKYLGDVVDDSIESSELPKAVRPPKTDKKEVDVRSANRSLWMDAEYLQVCERGKLKPSEEQFWDQLIDTYLKPLQTTPYQTLEVAAGLRSLRNNIAFTIILLNALMVLAIYLTQNHKDVLAFSWMPHEDFQQYKYNEKNQKWEMKPEPLKLEMLGLSIIFLLFGILVVQTVGLLLHRVNTIIGAFQEVQSMGEFYSAPTTKHEDDAKILDAARSMLDTCRYSQCHGRDGYVREAEDEDAQRNVLYRLQKQRLEKRLRSQAIPVPLH